MAKQPNMKIGIGADTSDFEKGAKQVKQGLKDLSKTGQQSISSLGDAFGVNTGKVDQMVSAVRGLGTKMTECGSTGVAAFGKLLSSITPLGGAIAGLGITAAIAGFKQLKAEADNFKSTIDGMNLSMATSAYISTYKQVPHDVNSDTGKSVAEAMSQWEKGWGRFKAQAGAVLTTFMTSSTLGDFAGSFGSLRQSFKEADEAATRNEQRGRELAEIQKQELQVRKDIADIDVEIAEQRRIIRDRSKSAEERAAAEVAVRDKIAEKTKMQSDMAEALYTLQSQITSEAGSTYDQMKEVTDLYVQWKGISASEVDQMASIDRYANSIASGTSKSAEAAKKFREEMAKMAEVQNKWSGQGTVSTEGISSLQGGVMGPSMTILPRVDGDYWRKTINAQLGDVTIGIGFKADTDQIYDITNEVTSLMEQSIARTGELIGNLVGTLAGGGDAWGDFKSAALSAFGDMAIAVGKIAISMGVAAAGIDVALKDTGQWYIAVAAGAALVALGAAVKSSLASVAGGDYSAAGGGYSGGGGSSSSGSSYETRDVHVTVNGTLQANGDQLIAVINNTNKRNYYTK